MKISSLIAATLTALSAVSEAQHTVQRFFMPESLGQCINGQLSTPPGFKHPTFITLISFPSGTCAQDATYSGSLNRCLTDVAPQTIVYTTCYDGAPKTELTPVNSYLGDIANGYVKFIASPDTKCGAIPFKADSNPGTSGTQLSSGSTIAFIPLSGTTGTQIFATTDYTGQTALFKFGQISCSGGNAQGKVNCNENQLSSGCIAVTGQCQRIAPGAEFYMQAVCPESTKASDATAVAKSDALLSAAVASLGAYLIYKQIW